MKNYLFTLTVLIVFAGGFNAVSAQNRRILADAERISGDRFAFSSRTQRGANVFAVSRPTPQMLSAIDGGLAALIAVSQKNGYRRRLNYSDYTIFIARPDRLKSAAGQYSPDIAVGAAQYAGTTYDQGGYIFAAGMVVASDPAAFLIAEHTRDFQRVRDVVRFEGEHLVLFANDRVRFSQTADHSRGGGHPILQ